MDVTPLIRRDAKIIQSYRGGAFKISGETFAHSVLVMADRVLEWRGDFGVLQGMGIEVLLLGTGEKQVLMAFAQRRAIKDAHGFMIESMDNGAAARTYNALMAEGRSVAVVLTA